MSRKDSEATIRHYIGLFEENGSLIDLKDTFIEDLPEDFDGESIFQDIMDFSGGEELAELCAEFVLTVNGDCDLDEFHNWNYDHLEFIIGLSNTYGFDIPKNLLNGLPEQLILLVDSDKVKKNGC